jgi:hypothetical protein
MTDRDIMQQALDALDQLYLPGELGRVNAVILALNKRLAHCDRCGKRLGGEGGIHTCSQKWVGLTDDGKMFVTPQSQPEQEPVAWMYQCTADNSRPVLLHQKQNWAESGTGLWVESPLYTNAPAAVQERVAYEYGDELYWHTNPALNDYIRANGKALVYATPPAAQRTWVELTDAEIDAEANSILTSDPVQWWRRLARAILAKSKEKNNGN